MNDQDEARVRELLIAFFREMHEWELQCRNLMNDVESGKADYDDIKKKIIEAFECIMSKHAALKAKRTRTAGNTFVYSKPPEYNPESEKIESVSIQRDKVLVRTKQSHHFKASYVYTLVDEGGDLRILNRKLVTHDGKLAVCHL